MLLTFIAGGTALSLPTAPHASAQTVAGGWCSSSSDAGWNPTYCVYKSPQAACQAMANALGTGGYIQAVEPLYSWYQWGCWARNPSGALFVQFNFECSDGNRVPMGRCTTEDFDARFNDKDDCAQPTGGTTPYPIDILSGAKRYKAADFATADGLLNLTRQYNGAPLGGGGAAVIGLPIGLSNWNFDFQYEVQINFQDSDPNDLASVVTPSGSAYVFQHQASGFVPYTPANRPNPQPKIKLTLLDPWPTGGGLEYGASHWQMTDEQDRVWNLQSYPGNYFRAVPTSMVDRSGRTITFTNDANGVLQSISDNYGKTISFDWMTDSVGAARVISAAHLPGGYTIQYSYNGPSGGGNVASNLAGAKFLDPSSVQLDAVTYQYGNTSFPNLVTGITDSGGIQRFTATYDSLGRATQSSKALGDQLYTVAYSAPGTTFTRTVTNPLGKQTTYNYSRSSTTTLDQKLTGTTGIASTNCPASSTSLSYGTDSFVSFATDELGHVSTYSWDPRALANTTVQASGTALARTTTTTWNPTWHVPDKIVYPTVTITFTYDTQGRMKTRTETDTTTFTTPYATNGRTRVWNYTWTAAGQPATVQGPRGVADIVTYTYNTNGYLQQITNELGQNMTVTTWDWRGEPTTIVDANSVTTTLTHDGYGRVLTATVNPGASQSFYQFAYNAMGDVTKITNPTGGFVQYTYDDAERVTLITNDRGETQTIGYGAADNPTSEVVKTSGGVTTHSWGATYDELVRLLHVVGAGSQTWVSGYDKKNHLTSVTDPLGHARAFEFDALDRIDKVTDPETHTQQLGYDAKDALNSFKDGRTITTTRTVDGFGFTIQEVSPDRGTRKYWYDGEGNLTKLIDGNSQETDFTYDSGNRLATTTFPAATAQNITYTYDQTTGGNLGVGRLTHVTDVSGSAAFVYDAQGRIISDTKTIGTHSYAVTYGYDASGRITQITYPSGRIVNIARAADGLPSSMTTKLNSGATAQNVATAIVYEPYGPLNTLTYGNGLALTRSYDANYWLTGVKVANGATNLLSLTYGLDNASRVTTVTDNASTGRGGSYAYTNSDRISQGIGPWGEEDYTYDASGNRATLKTIVSGTTTTTTDTITATNNQLSKTSVGGTTQRTLTYRAGGELSADAIAGGSTYNFGYDALNRLTSVKQGSTTVATYGYDAFTHLTSRVIGTPTLNYVYDEAGHLLTEQDGGTGAVRREYIWLDDRLMAFVDSTSGSAVTYYVSAGQTDAPLLVTNASKAIVWNAEIKPFGAAQFLTTATETLDQRFPGQWLEAVAEGLNHNGYRDYDPTLGRYIEPDPLGIEGGQNPYTYVDGSPIAFHDTKGLWASRFSFGVHQEAAEIAFGDELTADQRLLINEAQEWSDADVHQTAEFDFMHAMRRPGQSVQDACDETNRFLTLIATKAIAARQAGHMDKALFLFGVALHDMQDSTSPAHQGFQVWAGDNESFKSKAAHISKEYVYPGEGSELDQITHKAWAAFKSGNVNGFKIECPCR